MNIPDFSVWQGTPRDATQAIAALLRQQYPGVVAPTERVVRKWRQDGILNRSSRRFTGRNILEATYVAKQRKAGIALLDIAATLQGLDFSQLQATVLPQAGTTVGAGMPPALPPVDEQRLARVVILLAYGVLKQFQAVRAGHPVGVGLSHPDAGTAAATIPLALRQAQAQLARLAYEHGQLDEYASVHELLHRCTRPFREWMPQPLAQHPLYANVVLIEDEYWVPSRECGDFAEAGGHLADLIEQQIHRQLMDALARLDESEREAAYTLVRRFVAEYPMVARTAKTWKRLLTDPRLTLDIRAWLDAVYEPAHAALANKEGMVTHCAYCQAPLLPTHSQPRCVLTACRAAHPRPKAGESIPVAHALVARPEVLNYWCNPSLDELRLYQELQALFPQEDVQLYPHLDLCDVAVGMRIGIDVKDYANPVLLARKLNRGVGGLRLYDEMVVAVTPRQVRNRPEYLPQVREHLQPALRRSLRVLAVDDVLTILRTHGRFA